MSFASTKANLALAKIYFALAKYILAIKVLPLNYEHTASERLQFSEVLMKNFAIIIFCNFDVVWNYLLQTGELKLESKKSNFGLFTFTS